MYENLGLFVIKNTCINKLAKLLTWFHLNEESYWLHRKIIIDSYYKTM